MAFGAQFSSFFICLILAAVVLGLTPLRGDWQNVDIGPTVAAGSADLDDDTYTIKGSGVGVAGKADSFNYTFRIGTTSQTVIARVTGLTPTGGSSTAQSGLMVRSTVGFKAPYAAVIFTSGGHAYFQSRSKESAKTTMKKLKVTTLPLWIRLQIVRFGASTKCGVTASTSMDGVKWTTAGSASVPIGDNYLVGMAISSGLAGSLASATVDKISPRVPLYTAVDIGTLPARDFLPYDLNNKGEVVGNYVTSDTRVTRAFFYSGGTTIDLGMGDNSSAKGINDDGVVVGEYLVDEKFHPFILDGDNLTTLAFLGTGSQAAATGINSRGDVVGYSDISETNVNHPFLYSKNKMTDLGTAAGAVGEAEARKINQSGMVVGSSSVRNGGVQAYLYSKGQFKALGTLGGSFSEANGVNDAGVVVGDSYTASGYTHAFVTGVNGTGMTDLGTFGGHGAVALDVNNSGVIVGNASTSSEESRAFVYIPNIGMEDLNDHLTAPTSGSLMEGEGINDAGQIIVYGNGPGHSTAYLLTPVNN